MKSLQVLISSLALLGTISTLTPSVNATEVEVGTFSDQADIQSWSEIQIQALVEVGILTGYPDGTFKPNNTLTRAEFSVALYQAMDIMMMATENMSEIDRAEASAKFALLQEEIDALSLMVQESTDTVAVDENNNFVGLGISYAVDKASGTTAVITLMGKVQIVELSNKLALSARGFVNTDTVLGAGVTLDYDVTDKLELYVGAGAAYALDTNNVSALTGLKAQEVVPYANVGASYDLSDKTLVFVDGKIPLSVNNEETAEVTAGFGISF